MKKLVWSETRRRKGRDGSRASCRSRRRTTARSATWRAAAGHATRDPTSLRRQRGASPIRTPAGEVGDADASPKVTTSGGADRRRRALLDDDLNTALTIAAPAGRRSGVGAVRVRRAVHRARGHARGRAAGFRSAACWRATTARRSARW